MKRVKKTNFRDLFLSLILGILFSSMMGFLTGLRVLDMTPELAADLRNVFFLLISSMYLYAILGAALGLLLWAFIWILSRITGGGFHGRKFVSPWVALYLIGAGAFSVYFALTRQDLRTGNFDNALLIGYYLTVLVFGILLIRSIRPQTNKLTGKRNRLTLGRFWGVLLLYIVILVGVTLVSTNSRKTVLALGDPAEIKAALEEPNADVRVAIIGWDGAEWSVVEDLMQRGYLPNLQKLIESGVSAPFRSLPSTKSPLVWTSIATGKVPAKHGITDFGSFQFPGMVNNFAVYPDGLGYYRLISRFMRQADLPVTSSTRRCQSFWNIFTDADISTGLVGWWASWPAEPIDGFIVSDRFTYTLFNPNASAQTLQYGQTYPPEILDEVTQFCRTPDSITDEEYARFMPITRGEVVHPAAWENNQYKDWNPLYQFRLAYTAAESFKEAGLYLYEKYRPSMFAIYFQGVDMVSHFFWQYYRPFDYIDVPQSDVAAFGHVIPEFYRYMDETLGEILKTLEPGTDVMVMSDHGFGFDLQPAIPFRTGEHRVHGIFVASGPHFQQNLKLDEINVLDVTPTLLYLFGLPSGRDMDGQVRLEALRPDFVAANPQTSIKSYETGHKVSSITRSSTDQQVRDQIRALGYSN